MLRKPRALAPGWMDTSLKMFWVGFGVRLLKDVQVTVLGKVFRANGLGGF